MIRRFRRWWRDRRDPWFKRYNAGQVLVHDLRLDRVFDITLWGNGRASGWGNGLAQDEVLLLAHAGPAYEPTHYRILSIDFLDHDWDPFWRAELREYPPPVNNG